MNVNCVKSAVIQLGYFSVTFARVVINAANVMMNNVFEYRSASRFK